MFDALVKEKAKNIHKTYKMPLEDIETLIYNKLQKNDKLRTIWENLDKKDIYKRADFKKFIKDIKKEIYFNLRTYQKEEYQGLESHISTKERIGHTNHLFEHIDTFLKSAKTVIDIGGGLFPMSFPFKTYSQIEDYIWLDKDIKSYNKLKDYKKEQSLKMLRLFNDPIGKKPWNSYLTKNTKQFDLALMFKLIPVINRQNRELLNTLQNVPARSFVISGSKQAMVKNQNIKNRENRVIKKFILNTSKNIVEEFELENEFGYIIS